ncbi:MAG TPA: MarR family transcriptional regulator [Acidimicrobiales bacterium]|nr:MarR family transcriptional regulator [Acidimicrobiales bacterium]
MSAPTSQAEAGDAGSDALQELDLAESLLDSVGTFRRAVRHAVGGVLDEPLTGSQVELLRLLRRKPEVSVAEAADELRLAPNTVSTVVSQLIDAGLVRRSADPVDRRVARLSLTPTARRKLARWQSQRSARVAQCLSELSGSEREALAQAIALLERVSERLTPRR